MLQSNCLYCNKVFSYKKHSSTGKFCSSICSGNHRASLSRKNVEEGLVYDTKTLKRYLTDVRGYSCESCNITEWNGKPISLHVDHINGDSDNSTPSNIRLLCPNCHSQTDTFSGRNKKNSKRSTYMQRYRKRKLVGDDRIELP